LNKSAQLILFIIAMIALSTSPALSARVPKPTVSTLGGVSLTPTIGLISISGPGSRSTEPFYGLKIGYDHFGSSFVNSLGVEGNVNYYSKGNTSGFLGNLDVLYLFQATKSAVPYIVVGAGAINSGNAATSDTFPFINYGVGLKYFLKNYFALRGDVRHILAYESRNGSVHDDFNISFGISYYFGKPAPAKPAGKKTQQQLEKEKLEKEQKERELKEKEKKEQEELKKQQEEKEKKRKLEQQEQEKQQKELLHKEWEEFEQKGKGTGSSVNKPAEPETVNRTEIEPKHVMPEQAAPKQPVPALATPGQAVSGKAVPAQEAPTTVAPSKPTPALTVPRRETPAQAIQVQAAPTKEAPITVAPGKVTPTLSVPGQKAPAQAIPGQTVPGQAVKGQSAPRLTAPVQPAPAQETPTPAAPGQTTPAPTVTGRAASGQVVPGRATPGQATPVQKVPTQAVPVQAIPAHPAQVQPATGLKAPVQTAAVQPAPTPAAPGPVQTAPSVETKPSKKPGMTINIQYQTDKEVILPKYYPELAQVARYLKNNPHATGIIEGHADNRGGKIYNQKLSERRAHGVKIYLIRHFGINASRLKTKGYGYSKPIADNRTPEGRQKNRRATGNFGRVEIHFR